MYYIVLHSLYQFKGKNFKKFKRLKFENQRLKQKKSNLESKF